MLSGSNSRARVGGFLRRTRNLKQDHFHSAFSGGICQPSEVSRVMVEEPGQEGQRLSKMICGQANVPRRLNALPSVSMAVECFWHIFHPSYVWRRDKICFKWGGQNRKEAAPVLDESERSSVWCCSLVCLVKDLKVYWADYGVGFRKRLGSVSCSGPFSKRGRSSRARTLSVCMLNVGSIGIDIGASRLFYLRDLKVYVIYIIFEAA